MRRRSHHTLKAGYLPILAISAVCGLLAAALTTGSIGLLPPKLHAGGLKEAVAATHVFVDTGSTPVVNREFYDPGGLVTRAEELAEVLTSSQLVDEVGRRSHVPAGQIGFGTRVTANVPVDLTQPGSEERAAQITHSGLPYEIQTQARQTTPVLDIYTRAPTEAEALRLADTSVAVLSGYLRGLAVQDGLAARNRVVLHQLGPARGAPISGTMGMALAFLTFLVVTGVVAAGLFFLTRRRRGARPRPVPALAPADDHWPRTTRVTPWAIALFLAVLWLMPFNDIQLRVQLPIDLKFDRLVLPFVVAAWAIGPLVGGALARRWRLTWIHAAIGLFVLLAFTSVALEAQHLDRALELETSIKAIPLLIAYVSLFVVISTAVRGEEVRAFLTYTLVLAVICAVGVLIEYRFKYNIFYSWSAKVLPGIFDVASLDTTAVDTIGRRMVRGPAALPLETVAMLAMALPIALVSAIHAPRLRGRLLYGIAACLILAAAFATFRKSALLAPLSVIATIAYFRRRELLKLAPLGLVVIIVVHIAAPGALGKTTTQFDPSALGVTTVSDRTADYDAIRPDLWTHMLFGRGWGSYDWLSYRILDSEFLHRTMEMGVLGLISYVFMIVSVVFCARRTIADRDGTWAPLALMGAAAAVSFLVVSALFDVLAFPHATYIFLYTAGFTSVVISQRRGREERPLEPIEVTRRPGGDPPPDAGDPIGAGLDVPVLVGEL